MLCSEGQRCGHPLASFSEWSKNLFLSSLLKDWSCASGSFQRLEQKPGIDKRLLFQKDLWGSLLSDGVNFCDKCGRITRFLRIIYQLDWEGQKEDKIKDSFHTLKIVQARSKLIKLLNLKHLLPFKKKEGLLCRWSRSLEGEALKQRGLFMGLET